MTDYGLLGAFIVGLMGAGHCVGMCGGLVASFASQQSAIKIGENLLLKQLKLQFSYNFGRIVSYSIAGALLGGSAATLSHLFNVDDYLVWLRVFAGIMMIVTGLYIAQLWFGLTRIEFIGKYLWSKIGPTASKFLPIQTPKKAVIAGMIWGWLPCGLVYSTLTWSVASGSAVSGALIMFCFGLGTFPAMLSTGMAAKTLATWIQKKSVRVISGIFIILFGIQTLYVAYNQI
ncbi:sulfite exporter TauE/SafE family protein [Shewanella sp. 202IG2-18]|uniref:sulfite exporter TauE/SafE family protein n=1 Tax=Parashewanella hymeniacidonis TaxID=2807618 RepID=UPI00196070DB|nr:sulfite exporter TauE/SafE family protein [Parashewanella hymeniacidonis]MBM7072661.1 sulfite exporter TauE/SafE family protein [Parashewanella hymeniacidonis]